MNTPTVLITGALTGIGRAAALAFAREGARIVVSGRHDDKGKALVSELQELGAEAAFIKSDVRHEDEVRALVDETVRRFGRLDVAVNNAGTEGKPGPLTDQTPESYADTFDTNVLGTLLSLKHELRVMLPQGSGSIVNVSSTYGRAGAPGAALYVASKHAVEGFTKAAALEYAESGVRINVVAPGPTETGMLNRFTGTPENKADLISRVPLKRIAQPEEIAEAIISSPPIRLRISPGLHLPPMAKNWLAKAKRALRHGQYHIGEILRQREKLEGKIVITGGSAGIGLATMKHLIKEGAFVYITGRRKHNSNCEFNVAVVLKDNPTALANYIVQDKRPSV